MEEIKRQLSQDEYLIYIEQWKEENKELINSGKCKKVFLDILPRWESTANKGNINWELCNDYKICFIHNNVNGWIKIMNYNMKTKLIKLIYNEK